MAEMIANTSYDDIADVLYLTLTREAPGRYQEDEDGLIWRFNAAGQAIGVTVQAYYQLWGERREKLIERIATPLHLDRATVARNLPH